MVVRLQYGTVCGISSLRSSVPCSQQEAVRQLSSSVAQTFVMWDLIYCDWHCGLPRVRSCKAAQNAIRFRICSVGVVSTDVECRNAVESAADLGLEPWARNLRSWAKYSQDQLCNALGM